LSKDHKLFDLPSLVIGTLVAFGLAILILMLKMPDLTESMRKPDAEQYQAAVAERIRPLGQVTRPEEKQQAAAPTAVTETAAEPVATAMTGTEVYNGACLACHGNGVGGAPVVGDVAAWEPRIAQGADVLNDHAINGYQGVGYMPPKGGRLDLSDQEVIDAVAYMVAESTQ
jgi:cytochrome c5